MQEQTLFSYVPFDIENNFRENGFYYEDATYINIFRWFWNEHHIFPNIDTFPTDKTMRNIVRIYNPISRKTEHILTIGYDEAIIKSVEYISNNIKDFFNEYSNNDC